MSGKFKSKLDLSAEIGPNNLFIPRKFIGPALQGFRSSFISSALPMTSVDRTDFIAGMHNYFGMRIPPREVPTKNIPGMTK